MKTPHLAAALLCLAALAWSCGDDSNDPDRGTGGTLAGNTGGDGGTGPGGDGGIPGTGGAGGTGTGGTPGPGTGGTTGTGGSWVTTPLECQGAPCECSDGIDNDEDGLIDEFDPECSGPYDNDEATFATGIPGDNKGSKAGTECFFDGDSGIGNDDKCADYTPNGCDCFGCCFIDLNGNGTREQVGMFAPGCTTSRDPDAAPGTAGAACTTEADCDGGLDCIEDGDGTSRFCSACVACEQDTECVNPCEEGENCLGDPPGRVSFPPEGGEGGGGAGGEEPVCPGDRLSCVTSADCPGASEFCVTGCCTIFQ